MATWADVLGNQAVTCNNLQNACSDGWFYQKNPIPATDKCITKAEAEYYVEINTISGKTSNQLVVKNDLIVPGYYYQMEQFDCSTCVTTGSYVYAYSSTAAGRLNLNYYYPSSPTYPYSYRRKGLVSMTNGYTYNYSGVAGSATCVSCATTTTTTTVLGCTLWTFTNNSPDFGNTVTYTDCNNVLQSVYVPELSAPQYCVKIGTTPVPGDTYITVTDTTDTCI